MGLFSRDSYKIKNGICTVNFEKAGELTEERAKKILDIKEVKACQSIAVNIGKKVTAIGKSAFASRKSITTVSLSEGLVSIGDTAFFDCKGIDSIIIPNSVESIGKYAFAYCYGLKSIYIPISVELIDASIFADSFKTTIYCEASDLPSGWNKLWNSKKLLDSWDFNNDSEKIPSIFGIDGFGITESGLVWASTKDYALICNYIGSANEVTIPAQINGKTISAIQDWAFYESSIETITIPEGVEAIGINAFTQCASLERISLPNSVSRIGDYAFNNCQRLKEVELPKGLISMGKNIFEESGDIESISVDEDNEQYKSIDGSLYTKDGKVLIKYAGSKSKFVVPNGVTVIGSHAFAYCNSLESVIISRGVLEIGESAFSDCSGLESVTFNDDLKSIEYRAFYNCYNLKNVTIPECVSSIGEYAFCSCEALESIVIPKSVTAIGENAFEDCFNLTISCELSEPAEGWSKDWNPDFLSVIWRYDQPKGKTINY